MRRAASLHKGHLYSRDLSWAQSASPSAWRQTPAAARGHRCAPSSNFKVKGAPCATSGTGPTHSGVAQLTAAPVADAATGEAVLTSKSEPQAPAPSQSEAQRMLGMQPPPDDGLSDDEALQAVMKGRSAPAAEPRNHESARGITAALEPADGRQDAVQGGPYGNDLAGIRDGVRAPSAEAVASLVPARAGPATALTAIEPGVAAAGEAAREERAGQPVESLAAAAPVAAAEAPPAAVGRAKGAVREDEPAMASLGVSTAAELEAAAPSEPQPQTQQPPQEVPVELKTPTAAAAATATAAVSAGDIGSENKTLSPYADVEPPLDDTAVAISVLAAAAAAAAAAEADEMPYAPRGGTRRLTSTRELRPPARRPPRVVVYDGADGVKGLQDLISAAVGPTIIDLQGRVLTLGPSASAQPSASAKPLPSPPPVAAAATAALVPSSALRMAGWSSAVEAVSERARPWLESSSHRAGAEQQRLQGGGGGDAISSSPNAAAAAVGSNAVGGGGGYGGAVLLLHRDDITLANGTLQLQRGCLLQVTGRHVTLRRMEVVDVEGAAWWRQAPAMPATCLQTSALITVTAPPADKVSSSHPHLPATQLPPPLYIGGGPGDEGPSLELDDCSVIASGRDRDLLRADGSGAAVTARYSRLRGGANAAVATLQSSLSLDCCVLEGYASAGVVALGSSVRLVGSRLLGAAGAIVGLQAVAGSTMGALGCFLRDHSSNLECSAGSVVDLQGCVLSRSECRYGLTLHPATASTSSSQHHTPPPSSPAHASNGNPPPSRRSKVAAAAAGAAVQAAGRVRLSECEVGHAVQVGGGELELERCTFAMRPVPRDLPQPPLQITSDPELAAKLAAAVGATAAAAAAASRSGTGGGGGGGGAAFAGSVAAGAALRVVGCKVAGGGGGSEGEAVVVEAARAARVHVSGSPDVLIRRRSGGGGGAVA